MAELRECPFCGGEAKYHNGIDLEWKPVKVFCTVYCTKCKVSTPDFKDDAGDFEYKKRATEAWNRRAEDEMDK